MANAFRKNRLNGWGSPLFRLGILVATLTFAADQLSKLWVLNGLNLDARMPIQITPFMDLAMAWNKGVSYGLLETHMQGILVGISLAITGLLLVWLARADKPMTAASFGLLIGGALGNALDRVLYGAVADFVHLHWGAWSWYVFNVADIAIVAGVLVLLYDAFLGTHKI